jgi:hypothetical protein
MQQEAVNLSVTYGLSPRLFFLVDEPPNAYATREVANAFGLDGTVLFGQNLTTEQLSRDPSGSTLLAVMAHEFGHIAQFRNGLSESGKRPELHADFLAGWYLAVRGRYAWANLMPALRVFYDLGDYAFNSPLHHGTPDERLAASQAGFNSSAFTAQQAYAAGWEFVR